MRDILPTLLDTLQKATPLVYCRLVETRGSTPQKPGATMLVFPGGQQVGTLGGGCVEADVKRSALRALSDHTPCIATFQLDHDYGWDDGLICGGRVKILVRPVEPSSDASRYLRRLCEVHRSGAGTEVIVFDAELSGLPEASCYLFDGAGELVDLLPTGSPVPDIVREHLTSLDVRPRAYAAQGMAFLPTVPRCRLVVVGGGHVGKAVADLAVTLDFDVWVIDDRAEFASAERFPHAYAGGWRETWSSCCRQLEIDPHTYCLIVTRGHTHDERALFHLVQRNAAYVGMIGSRRKIRMIFDDLVQEGVPEVALQAGLRAAGHPYRFADGPGNRRQHLCRAGCPPKSRRPGSRGARGDRGEWAVR